MDESVFNCTDARARGWWFPGVTNQQTRNARLNKVNMIAAVTSAGGFYYTVNYGRTNSNTFFYFLMKVMNHLESISSTWRDEYIFLVDNASYHRSKDNMARYCTLGVPILFLGPYHFRLAPVELMFCYIKERNLNTLFSKVSSK